MKRNKVLNKILASILLILFNVNIFGNVVLDPNSKYNTSLDSSQTGVPIVNISTPNSRGISVNDFLEYNVGKEGQVLNSADNVGRSHLAGLINSNPNLSANQAASLIVLQVNGANRSNIEGYIEALSREKVNVILSNENGIYLDGAGTINIKNFIPTTGKVKLQNGDYVGIDVSRGNIVIGSNGLDISKTDYVDIISKTLELHGNVVGTDLRVVTGSNEISKDGKITKKQGTPATVAIDGSQLGGMYAGQIKIIATDKGAGVNNKAFIVSKDSQLEISADGKVSVNKVQGQGINIVGTDYEQTDMAYSDKGINIKGNTITLSGTGTQANENINLDGNVINSGQIYTKSELNTKDLVTSGDVQVTGNINVNGLLNNSGNVQGSNKLNVLNNGINSGTLQILDRVTFGGNLTNSGDILTNENIVAQNTTNSGNIIGKNITLGNVTNTNTGKIQTTETLNVGNVLNNGNILSVGTITGKNVDNSGKILSNNEINVKDIKNIQTIQAVKSITADEINNSGEISTNENILGKNTISSGEINGKNIILGNVTNTGKIQAQKDLQTSNITNSGDIFVVGGISGDNVNNSGKILSNDEVTVKDVTNTGKIVSGKSITTNNVDNKGTLATNDNIKINGSLDNDTNATIEGKDVEVQGNHLNNKGKISVDNISATVTTTTNDGKILSVNDIELKTQNLVNSGEILAGNDIKANNTNLNNNGKIASNNSISLENSGINNSSTGEILSDNINMSNATSFANNGKISGGETKLTTSGNLNLVGTLHGQRKLTIEANDIENNGKTTSTGTISIKSRDFKNNEELSADTILIDASGDIVNNDMITGNQGGIKGNNIENNDLIATDNVLLLEAKNKLTNTSGSTIYGGKLQIKSNEILNEKQGEILGGSLININTSTLRNEVGTIQSSGDIFIKANKVENIGEVTGFGNYERYYVTPDGKVMTEAEVKNKWIAPVDNSDKVKKKKHKRWQSFKVNFIKYDIINGLKAKGKLESELLKKYGKEILKDVNDQDRSETIESTGSKYKLDLLDGRIKNNATTEYGKILASNDMTIIASDVKNKDGIMSAGNTLKIDTTNLENSVTIDEKNPLKDLNGVEKISLSRSGGLKWKLRASYTRDLVAQGIIYESGQPSIIEGSQVIINAPNIVTQPIPEAQGIVVTGNPTNGVSNSLFNKIINKGVSQNNSNVQVSNNLQNIQIANNMSPIQNIINTGTLTVNPVMTSAMFTQNVNPSSKYLMETRSKYINLSSYYGSDYFLTKIGYTPGWNRVRRLGDAYYENQLLTRGIAEKLGTAFINGKSNEQLIKDLMDNAGLEASRLGLKLGEELTPEQISNLSKDLVWYVVKEVNGVEVLVPQIYFSQTTLSTLSVDGRNKIGGTNYTYVQSENLENNGTKIGNGGTTIVDVRSLRNETVTNQLSEITGDRTYIVSDGNIENIGGSINGNNIVSLVSLNGDIINDTTKSTYEYNYGDLNRSRNETIKSVGEISSNGTTYIEGKNYTSTGAVTLGDTVTINAKENVNINSLELTGESKHGINNDNYNSYSKVENVGSSVQGINGVTITVGKDVNISGSEVASNGNVIVTGENINITNEVNSVKEESKYKDKGIVSKEEASKNSYVESNQSSTVYGNNVVLRATNDVNVKASNIGAEKDILGLGGNVVITAGKDVNIVEETLVEKHNSYEKKSGISVSGSIGSGGINVGAGYSSTKTNKNSEKETAATSSIVSEGDTTIIAGGIIESHSTTFIADDLNITGKNGINLVDATEKYSEHYDSKTKSVGVSLNVGSTLLDAYNAGESLSNTKKSDLGNRYAIANTALNALGDTRTIANTGGKVADVIGGKSKPSSLVNVTVGLNIGTSKTSSDISGENSVTGQITANNVNLNSDGSVVLRNQNVNIANDLNITAKDLTIEAGKNTYESSNSSSSRGVSVSSDVVSNTGNIGLSASENKGNERGVSYTNSIVNVGGKTTITTDENVKISGANITTSEIDAKIGGNLLVESLQDEVQGTRSGYGLSVSTPIATTKNKETGENETKLGTPSIGGSVSDGETKGAWVSNQTSITVIEKGKIDVQGETTLRGSVISSEKNPLTLTTEKLITEDIYDSYDSEDTTIGVSGLTTKKYEDRDENGNKVIKTGIKIPQTNVEYDSKEKEQITRTTLSNVEVVENGEKVDLEARGINTDKEKSQEITKDEEKHFGAPLHTDLLNKEEREEFVEDFKKTTQLPGKVIEGIAYALKEEKTEEGNVVNKKLGTSISASVRDMNIDVTIKTDENRKDYEEALNKTLNENGEYTDASLLLVQGIVEQVLVEKGIEADRIVFTTNSKVEGSNAKTNGKNFIINLNSVDISNFDNVVELAQYEGQRFNYDNKSEDDVAVHQGIDLSNNLGSTKISSESTILSHGNEFVENEDLSEYRDRRYKNKKELIDTHRYTSGPYKDQINITYFNNVYSTYGEIVNDVVKYEKSKSRLDRIKSFISDQIVDEIKGKVEDIHYLVKILNIVYDAYKDVKVSSKTEEGISEYIWMKKKMLQDTADLIIFTNQEVIFSITDSIDKKEKEKSVLYDPNNIKEKPTIYNEVYVEFNRDPNGTYKKYKSEFDKELNKRKLTPKELMQMKVDVEDYFKYNQDPEFFFEAGRFKFIKPREAQNGKSKSVGERSYIIKILPDMKKMKERN